MRYFVLNDNEQKYFRIVGKCQKNTSDYTVLVLK